MIFIEYKITKLICCLGISYNNLVIWVPNGILSIIRRNYILSKFDDIFTIKDMQRTPQWCRKSVKNVYVLSSMTSV